MLIIAQIKPLGAWSNGGYSSDPANPDYGTHDWIAQHALDWLPSDEKQYIVDNLAAYLYGTELPDNAGAPAGIGDTILHHIYYRNDGSLQDDAAAVRAQEEYNNAFVALENLDPIAAAQSVGVMSHYIADVSVFGHVMGGGSDWGAENHHADYESYVNTRTSNYSDEFDSYLIFDGDLRLISAYDAAIALAYDTTFDVDGNYTCLWMDQNYNWSDPAFTDRCGESLNLAVNYLADVLHSLYVETTLLVSPSSVEYWTPAHNQQFTLRVEIMNVVDLYGFEFKLHWNATLLNLAEVEVTPPESWGPDYFIAKNESDNALGRYWLALGALSPVPPFLGSSILVQLAFAIIYDPIYPENVSSHFDLLDTELSDMEANAIPHAVHDGEYWCYASEPIIDAAPQTCIAMTLGEEFAIHVLIRDVVNLYGFKFEISYNTTYLDAIDIAIGSFIHPPFVITQQSIEDSTGTVLVSVDAINPAPAANGSGTLATVTFKVSMTCGVWYNGSVPFECNLLLSNTMLSASDGTPVPHAASNPMTHFTYCPIPGDLNSDGIVNVLDLILTANAFGCGPSDPDWDARCDLTCDAIINIYDLVLVCANYGKTEP